MFEKLTDGKYQRIASIYRLMDINLKKSAREFRSQEYDKSVRQLKFLRNQIDLIEQLMGKKPEDEETF